MDKISGWLANKGIGSRNRVTSNEASRTQSDARVNALVMKHSRNVLDKLRVSVGESISAKEKLEHIGNGIRSLQRVIDLSSCPSCDSGSALSQMEVWSDIVKLQLMTSESNEHSIVEIEEHINKLAVDLKRVNLDDPIIHDAFIDSVTSLCDYIDKLSTKGYSRSLPLHKLLYASSMKGSDLIRIKKKECAQNVVLRSKSDTKRRSDLDPNWMSVASPRAPGFKAGALNTVSEEDEDSDDDYEELPECLTAESDKFFSNRIQHARIHGEESRELLDAISFDAENCLSTSLSTDLEARAERINTLIRHAREVAPAIKRSDRKYYEELTKELNIIQSMLSLEIALKTPHMTKDRWQNIMREITTQLNIFGNQTPKLLFHGYPENIGILPYMLTIIKNRHDLYNSREARAMLPSAVRFMMRFAGSLEKR